MLDALIVLAIPAGLHTTLRDERKYRNNVLHISDRAGRQTNGYNKAANVAVIGDSEISVMYVVVDVTEVTSSRRLCCWQKETEVG
jgi:hypothetical protein